MFCYPPAFTGIIRIKSDELLEVNQLENQSNEAYELFLELNPNCDYIKKINGRYENGRVYE